MSTDTTFVTKPRCARCSLGPTRWFWVVWTYDDDWETHVSDSGYACSAEEAEQAAASCCSEAERCPAGWANDYGPDGWTEHRVLKKTKSRYYVQERCSYDEERSFTLDRQELEEKGCAWSRTEREFFYTESGVKDFEGRQRSKQINPQWAVILGVEPDATKDEIEAAYRKRAMETHPDHGGDAKEFRELQAAWERFIQVGAA